MRALLVAVSLTTVAAFAAARAPQLPQHPAPRYPASTPQPAAPAQPPRQIREHRPPNHSIPQDRAADSYAIYSLLMPGKLFQHLQNAAGHRWAVAEKTVTFSEMNPRIDPRGALKPPPGNEKAFHQAVSDFELSRELSYTLQPRLHIGHPYDLLSPDQVRDLRHAKAGLDPGSRLRARYADYPGVTFFSAVYFSKDQKAALVYVNDWCGVLCTQGQWVYLEKIHGQWQRKSGITVPGA